MNKIILIVCISLFLLSCEFNKNPSKSIPVDIGSTVLPLTLDDWIEIEKYSYCIELMNGDPSKCPNPDTHNGINPINGLSWEEIKKEQIEIYKEFENYRITKTFQIKENEKNLQ